MKTCIPFELYDLRTRLGAFVMLNDWPGMVLHWVQKMERGADCAVCGKRLKKGAGRRRGPALVAVGEIPAEDQAEPQAIVVTMCGRCVDGHASQAAAAEALCKATAGFLGVTDGELVLPMPEHDSVQ